MKRVLLRCQVACLLAVSMFSAQSVGCAGRVSQGQRMLKGYSTGQLRIHQHRNSSRFLCPAPICGPVR